jgi:hypothetical protein
MNKTGHWLAAALFAGTDLAAGTAYFTEGADWILYALACILIAFAIRALRT